MTGLCDSLFANRTGLSQYPVFKVQARQALACFPALLPAVNHRTVARRRGDTLRTHLDPVNNSFRSFSTRFPSRLRRTETPSADAPRGRRGPVSCPASRHSMAPLHCSSCHRQLRVFRAGTAMLADPRDLRAVHPNTHRAPGHRRKVLRISYLLYIPVRAHSR